MPLNDLKKGAKYKTEKELLENTKWIAIKWVFMQEQLFEALVSASRICLTNSTLRQFLCHCAYFPLFLCRGRPGGQAQPLPGGSGMFWRALERSAGFSPYPSAPPSSPVPLRAPQRLWRWLCGSRQPRREVEPGGRGLGASLLSVCPCAKLF